MYVVQNVEYKEMNDDNNGTDKSKIFGSFDLIASKIGVAENNKRVAERTKIVREMERERQNEARSNIESEKEE